MLLILLDYGIDGEGIAKIDGFTIFVQNAMKGENADFDFKSNKTHACKNCKYN